MSLAHWYIGICLVIAILCFIIFCHGISHPQKSKQNALITYDLTNHRMGIMYCESIDTAAEDDEEVDP